VAEWQMEADDDGSQTRDTEVVRQPVGDSSSSNYDASTWNLTFGVNNHLVLLAVNFTALFVICLVPSLLLFVWSWRGCLVSSRFQVLRGLGRAQFLGV